MGDLFRNPKMAKVLPQFGDNQPLQNVYSFAEIDRRVREHLQKTFGARKTADGLTIKGKFAEVFSQVKDLATTLENFFNSIPAITKNIRSNTKVYLPYASVQQMADILCNGGHNECREQGGGYGAGATKHTIQPRF